MASNCSSSRPTPTYFQLQMTPVPRPRSRSKSPSTSRSTYPKPVYRLQLNDLSHKGTADFLSVVNPATVLEETVATVLKLLYKIEPHNASIAHATPDTASSTQRPRPSNEDAVPFTQSALPSIPTPTALISSSPPSASLLPPLLPRSNTSAEQQTVSPIPNPPSNPHPPVRSITLLLRAIDGVGYTTGKEIDDEHKEIHLNINYVSTREPSLLRSEIAGFLVHEMVHVWQWNGLGTANGGLIEGIADWVRLRAGLAPPHWKRRRGQRWDQGYETTGYFLDWMERVRCGEGTVRAVNRWLRTRKYEEELLWREVCGDDVGVLWNDYEKWVEKEGLYGD